MKLQQSVMSKTWTGTFFSGNKNHHPHFLWSNSISVPIFRFQFSDHVPNFHVLHKTNTLKICFAKTQATFFSAEFSS